MAVHPCDTGSPISAVARNRKDEPASYGNTRKVNTADEPAEGREGDEPGAAEAVVGEAVGEAVADAVADAEAAGVPVAVAAATVVVGCVSTV